MPARYPSFSDLLRDRPTRRRRADRRKDPDAHLKAPASRAEAMLTMQRMAGNAAVVRILRQPAPVQEPTLAGEIGKATKPIRVVTEPIDPGGSLEDLGGYFEPRDPDNDRPDTISPLPANVTAVFGKGIPDKGFLRVGLQSVGSELMDVAVKKDINSEKEKPWQVFTPNFTVQVRLDLSPYGGELGLYRFTYLELMPAPSTKKTKKKAGKKYELLIECIERWAVPKPEPKLKSQPGSKQGQKAAPDAGETRFKQFGFTISGYSQADKACVYAAVLLIPDAALNRVNGVRFLRDSVYAADPQAGGNYDPNAHTITMFDRAFLKTLVRFNRPGAGVTTEAVREVAHELGHAVDRAPLRKAWAEYDKNQAASGAEEKLEGVVSPSGQQWTVPTSGPVTTKEKGGAKATPFRAAATNDGGVRVTRYSEKSWEEHFAECFSLYVTDPELLRTIRPSVYTYFDAEFSRTQQKTGGSAAQAKQPSPAKAGVR